MSYTDQGVVNLPAEFKYIQTLVLITIFQFSKQSILILKIRKYSKGKTRWLVFLIIISWSSDSFVEISVIHN